MNAFDNLFLTFIVTAIIFFTAGTAYIAIKLKTAWIPYATKLIQAVKK